MDVGLLAKKFAFSLDSTVTHWSDYLKSFVHPRSICPLPNSYFSSISNVSVAWSSGEQALRNVDEVVCASPFVSFESHVALARRSREFVTLVPGGMRSSRGSAIVSGHQWRLRIVCARGALDAPRRSASIAVVGCGPLRSRLIFCTADVLSWFWSNSSI